MGQFKVDERVVTKKLPSEDFLTFPCKIAIKAMGLKQNHFDAHVLQIIKHHQENVSDSDVCTRDSKNSKYLAVTVMVSLESREQADNIYRDLTADERILMAL